MSWQLDTDVQKIEFNLYFTSYTKINPKWILDQNIRIKTTKHRYVFVTLDLAIIS